MASYLLPHRHEPDECGVAFTSFKGHDSPLRHRPALASCRTGGHEIWGAVQAGGQDKPLRLLPLFLAKRTTLTRGHEDQIPLQRRPNRLPPPPPPPAAGDGAEPT